MDAFDFNLGQSRSLAKRQKFRVRRANRARGRHCLPDYSFSFECD